MGLVCRKDVYFFLDIKGNRYTFETVCLPSEEVGVLNSKQEVTKAVWLRRLEKIISWSR